MAVASEAVPNVADLLTQIGDVPTLRVLLRPFPGSATEQDVIDIQLGQKRLCELVDGVLVEKTNGFQESILAAILIQYLDLFVSNHVRGIVAGADGTLRLRPGQVRIPGSLLHLL